MGRGLGGLGETLLYVLFFFCFVLFWVLIELGWGVLGMVLMAWRNCYCHGHLGVFVDFLRREGTESVV